MESRYISLTHALTLIKSSYTSVKNTLIDSWPLTELSWTNRNLISLKIILRINSSVIKQDHIIFYIVHTKKDVVLVLSIFIFPLGVHAKLNNSCPRPHPKNSWTLKHTIKYTYCKQPSLIIALINSCKWYKLF